ncbi:MAG: hypothetical protein LBK29_03500 [Oscillospiraceae bacterium]|jgi:hypothetical protein|nr:hypothetical protein [Oscillospiraceae bacterium]
MAKNLKKTFFRIFSLILIIFTNQNNLNTFAVVPARRFDFTKKSPEYEKINSDSTLKSNYDNTDEETNSNITLKLLASFSLGSLLCYLIFGKPASEKSEKPENNDTDRKKFFESFGNIIEILKALGSSESGAAIPVESHKPILRSAAESYSILVLHENDISYFLPDDLVQNIQDLLNNFVIFKTSNASFNKVIEDLNELKDIAVREDIFRKMLRICSFVLAASRASDQTGDAIFMPIRKCNRNSLLF